MVKQICNNFGWKWQYRLKYRCLVSSERRFHELKPRNTFRCFCPEMPSTLLCTRFYSAVCTLYRWWNSRACVGSNIRGINSGWPNGRSFLSKTIATYTKMYIGNITRNRNTERLHTCDLSLLFIFISCGLCKAMKFSVWYNNCGRLKCNFKNEKIMFKILRNSCIETRNLQL